ncbi:auxin efflux carrier family protein [Natrinema pellirubrum DSM 15624]|uniref:Auxin efflux carrier family protein n=1 Tax=Natrinema pellirubrum (strain DSM 15624 / CIP 106293 / JCM 10476 / NCIMB 786 / 157) TaxID=797303 RepID=L0JRP2_NATP1|nr:AEC family transporter [Natrinema pellirubrum]AGB33493.1 putative permease [Natrinema pellirubrum DSM 15624]ELY70724.1 auxin efflux carrier family protein [Natrinema pellirubrum DSM 15624]
MADLLAIFGSAIGPIVAIAAVGYLLATVKEIDPEPLNTAVVYVLAPALVFHSLATTELEVATLVRVTVGIGVFTAAMWAVAELAGRAVGEREPALSGLVLVAIFTNSGNLGIPVSDFAFGAVGRQTAVLFLSVQSVLMYTVGVYVASRSSGSAGLEGVRRVFYIPLVYAVAAALGARALGLVPPADTAAMETLGLVGDASIPLMLLILGIQLARADTASAVSRAWPATALKTVVAPLVGLGVALLIGFENPTVARVFVLETAMPAAVTPLVLVIEFADGARTEGILVSEYVSTCVLLTTLLSVPILTALIALLQSGVVI